MGLKRVIKETDVKKPLKNVTNKATQEEKSEKVISEYVAKLENTLREKSNFSFWVFPERAGFKKITKVSFKDMQKALKHDVAKYANTQICEFKISTRKTKDKYGTWLSVSIWVITTDKEANMEGDNVKNNSCTFKWDSNDFKTTKFSFKLLEAMMHVIAQNKHRCPDLLGFPITWVLSEMKKKRINLDEYLKPLAGA